jgi:hypothetical protein
MAIASLVALAGAIIAACYTVPAPDCGFACGPNGACPDDYTCAADHRCHRVGAPASLVCSTPDAAAPSDTRDAAIDGVSDAPVDATVDAMADASVDAAVDAPVDAPVDAMIGARIDAQIDAMIDAYDPMDDAIIIYYAPARR